MKEKWERQKRLTSRGYLFFIIFHSFPIPIPPLRYYIFLCVFHRNCCIDSRQKLEKQTSPTVLFQTRSDKRRRIDGKDSIAMETYLEFKTQNAMRFFLFVSVVWMNVCDVMSYQGRVCSIF